MLQLTNLVLICSLVNTTVIINKPYKNLKIINSWKSVVKDRELVQCYIDKEFKNKQSACSKDSSVDSKGRKLAQMLRTATNCAACRRTKYKDQIVKCREAISGMFKEFLKYEMTSGQEKQAYLDLITSFARYVLLLKEFQESGKVPMDPQKNIQNFIDDEVFDMRRRGTGIISGKTFRIPQPDGTVATMQTKTLHLNGVKVSTPLQVEHPAETKTRMDNKAKHLDILAQDMIDKYDDPHLRKEMHSKGKLIKVTPRRRKKVQFHKYSFRFGDIDKKIRNIKRINHPKHLPNVHKEPVHVADPLPQSSKFDF